MLPSPVQVSFIIPLFNCLALTRACVESLAATLPPGLAHEIVLVDDGSTDGTREWLATLRAPFRVTLNERNLGYALANNRGGALATGNLLLLLNNDLVLPPGWLEPMLAALADPRMRAGIVGNVQLDARTGATDHAGIVLTAQGKPEHARALPSFAWRRSARVRRVPAVTGACLLIERALWKQLGGFDHGFVNGGEDVDLCYRARAAGRNTVVALDSVVRHHVSSSFGRKLRDEQNSFRLARRWRKEFIRDATQAWCRAYLQGAWVDPQSREHRLARHALRHAAGLTVIPPPEAITGLEAAQAREFARWDTLFG
ncbi:MAG: hypothetical protein RIQ93_2695 [Verrucomicrobiota bacterium]|jgi:GT2 family glycosyltransferase